MSLLFLLLLTTTATALTPSSISSHPHHPHHHRHPSAHSPPPPPPPTLQPPTDLPPDPLTDLIYALTSTSDFQAWASRLLFATSIPGVSATLFVPSDASLSHLPTQFDDLLIPYHIVPNSLLNFSSLLNLSPLSRLPTLLPYHYLLLTNTSASNFTVDETLITLPDLFLSPNFAVHGIQNVLDYSLYLDIPIENGTGGSGSLPPPPPTPIPQVVVGWGSGANMEGEFGIVFLLVFFSGLAIDRLVL